MDQHELNRAVAKATMESVKTIANLGFSLLTLPSANPLAVRSQRKRPLRLAHEPRKRKPPRRKMKSSTGSAPAIRPVAKHSGGNVTILFMPPMRLTFFDQGA